MKVKIGNNYSEKKNIQYGVLQRSVLRYLLFLIFINNLPNDIKSKINLFADYIKLFETRKIALNKLSYSEDIWKLRFNIE